MIDPALKENLDSLRTILAGGAFPDDMAVIGSWERELTKAQRQHDLYKHPALVAFWGALKTEIDGLNAILLNTEELPERQVIFKYRNFLQNLLSSHENALNRAESISNKITAEAERLRSTAT